MSSNERREDTQEQKVPRENRWPEMFWGSASLGVWEQEGETPNVDTVLWRRGDWVELQGQRDWTREF